MVVLGLADLEPLATIESAAFGLATIGPLRMTVEHAEHLAAIGDALVNLADGERFTGLLLWAQRAGAHRILADALSVQPCLTPPARPPLRPAGSRASAAGRSFTLDADGGHAAAAFFSLFFCFACPGPELFVPVVR